MRKVGILVTLALAALASPARAVELAEGRLSVAGFGGWAYGRTSGENVYFVGGPEGNYENAQFSLAVTAQPEDEIIAAGQLFFAPDGEVALDWAFAEYRLHDLLRVRAGKVKTPYGIFMEVRDVGTLRPFFTLPHSVYGAGGFGAEAYLGVGLTGVWASSGGWELSYDLYGGAMDVPAFHPWAVGDATLPPWDFSTLAAEELEAKDVVGGRITVGTPLTGLTFRLSGYAGEVEEGEATERVVSYGASVEYALDRLQVRGEVFRAELGDALESLAGYAEIAWFVLPKLQLSARFEALREELGSLPSSQFQEHTEGAFGIAYWPSADLAFKASYHRIEGNRLAVPLGEPVVAEVDEKTDLFVAGVQFAF